MGAFYLKSNQSRTEFKSPNSFFQNKGMVITKRCYLGGWELFLYGKALKPCHNFRERGDFLMSVIGTPVYRNLDYTCGLDKLFNDFVKGEFTTENIFGHYVIILWDGLGLSLYTDGSGLLKIYQNHRTHDISSSFLALIDNDQESFTLKKNVVVENLLTGGIIGVKTIFDQITVLSEERSSEDSIILHSPKANPQEIKFSGRKDAINYQIELLENYFSSIQTFCESQGTDLGLTGGFDSRLLLAFVNKYFKMAQVHSHNRGKSNDEWTIAQDLAKQINIPFVSPEVQSWTSRSDKEKEQVLTEALLFNDGQMRTHCYWHEEYNTAFYRQRVLNTKGVGFSGIGGEQYRNNDRYPEGAASFSEWIKYKIIFKWGIDPFKNSKYKKAFSSNLINEISDLTSIPRTTNHLTLLDVKRINNEVLLKSYRGARVHHENTLSFFLSPFSDHKVSFDAYSIIPFLGRDAEFEREMICLAGPQLALINSSYGYPFSKQEPLTKRIAFSIFYDRLPFKFTQVLLNVIKRIKSDTGIKKRNECNLEAQLFDNVVSLNLPIDIRLMLTNPNTMPLILSMGFFIEKLKAKIAL